MQAAKKDQAEVAQDTIYCVGGCRSFLPFLLSSCPLPTLSFLLVSHSSFLMHSKPAAECFSSSWGAL